MEKTLGASNGVLNLSFCHFLKVGPLVLLDIAQDYSFRQCLTSSRAETSNENLWRKLEPK